jgi:hypothetical protein
MHPEDDEEEDWHPEDGKRLPDGSIELTIRCDFDLHPEGHFEHHSTVWDGTNETPGPDHGVWMIPSHPTGFEGDEIIDGFLKDAEGMFNEGTTYVLVVKLSLDWHSPTVRQRRFTYRAGMFETE